MSGWRYLAARLNGDGTEKWISNEVPLSGVELREDLSGPGGLTGTISPEMTQLKGAEEPLLVPWSTAIYAEEDGQIRAGAILVDVREDGPDLSLDCVGFTGYASGIPYTSDYIRVKEDPLNIVRHIWSHIQGQKRGNIGLVVDSTTSKVRIGDGPDAAAFGDNQGPYRLSWFATNDLGDEIDELAANTPFEYRVDHAWNSDKSAVTHKLVLGYPDIGRRRHDLRFVVGENVTQLPEIQYSGDEYSNEIIVLGAGEGREMVRGGAVRDLGRLRRPTVVIDKGISSKKTADALAARELKFWLGDADIADFEVWDHANAPFGSYNVGDDVLLQTVDGWSDDLSMWSRIISIKFNPESNIATISVIRADKVR